MNIENNEKQAFIDIKTLENDIEQKKNQLKQLSRCLVPNSVNTIMDGISTNTFFNNEQKKNLLLICENYCNENVQEWKENFECKQVLSYYSLPPDIVYDNSPESIYEKKILLDSINAICAMQFNNEKSRNLIEHIKNKYSNIEKLTVEELEDIKLLLVEWDKYEINIDDKGEVCYKLKNRKRLFGS